MLIPDVNVWLAALHAEFRPLGAREWVINALGGVEPVGLSPAVASGLLRLATSPRILQSPSSPAVVVAGIRSLLRHPNCRLVQPGRANLELFLRLCEEVPTAGNDVSDACHAALAIEHDATLISYDRGFARFPGLRWRHPEHAVDE